MGGNQQGGNGIDKRGLPRADVPCEQARLTARLYGPDLAVKCPPVIHFKAIEAEAGLCEIDKFQNALLHRSLIPIHRQLAVLSKLALKIREPLGIDK